MLNPAMFLPEKLADHPHDYGEVLTQITGIRPDLRDTSLRDVEMTLFIDGSSYMANGKRYAGAAVVSPEQELWKVALPHGTSAQKVELTAFTKALQMAKVTAGATVCLKKSPRRDPSCLH